MPFITLERLHARLICLGEELIVDKANWVYSDRSFLINERNRSSIKAFKLLHRDIRELQKMNAFTIVSVFSYICLLASLALNILLMVVVSRYSAKYLIPYRRPLLITAVANLGLSVCFMLLQPVS